MRKIDWPETYGLANGLRFVDELDVTQRTAYTSSRGIFIRRAGARKLRRLVGARRQSVACPLVFSPDGRTLYHSHEQLEAIDVRSGHSRPVTAFGKDDQFGVSWDLQVSPNGETLYFRHSPEAASGGRGKWTARFCAIDARGRDFRVLFEPTSELGRIWRASCDFERGSVDILLTSGGRRSLFSVDLDGRNLRPREPARYGARSGPDSECFNLPHGDHVYVPRAPDRLAGATWRDAAALAPDRRSVAFVRDEHELWYWRFDEAHASRLVWARRGTELDRNAGWAIAPSFSPDGALLWFSSTTSKRWPSPRHPEFVARVKREIADPEEQRSSIERDRWTMKHRVGFLDLASGAVWMRRGYWSDLAWMRVG